MIINPTFSQKTDLFIRRKKEYEQLEENVKIACQPILDMGYEILDFGLRDFRVSRKELFETYKQEFVLKFIKNDLTLDLSILIPKLINDNYIIINGRKKIPFFQLTNKPIIHVKEHTRLLQTNVATFYLKNNINSKKSEYNVLFNFLNGQKIPFAHLLFCYFEKDHILEIMEKFDKEIEDKHEFFNCIRTDLNSFIEKNENISKNTLIENLGKYYTKYNALEKGKAILYALDIIPKIDIYCKKFMKYENVLEELIYFSSIKNWKSNDLRTRRVRSVEYMIFTKIAKSIFDFCFININSNKPKFNVNSTQILNDCNISEIVHFDFAINPVSEISDLTRITLVGPGGFSKTNTSPDLRDINKSMFGRICPVDTPDRDNCGVLQSLVPNCKLNIDYDFSENKLDKQIISVPVSMVPFLENDDQTRLQMSSSQQRQSILLKNPDIPLVKSSCENLYTQFSKFIKIAKMNGKVIFKDDEIMIIKYEDETTELIYLKPSSIYTSSMLYLITDLEINQKVKIGDILAKSKFINNMDICQGKNLKTAIMIYHGGNYEDAIVISDRLVKEEILTSSHFIDLSFNLPSNGILLSLDAEKTSLRKKLNEKTNKSKKDYYPLPKVGDILNPGDVYAIIKKMPDLDNETISIFESPTEMTVDKKTIITKVNIYPNTWYKEIVEFNEWVQEKNSSQIEREEKLIEFLNKNLNKEETNKISNILQLGKSSKVGEYKIKSEKINGVYIEIEGIQEKNICVGDKLANRHGNKGVISMILKEDKMPKLEDGSSVDICINPLGIISRMNIGQMYELHLGMSVNDLKNTCLKMLEKKDHNEKIKNYLIEYIKIIDNTQDNWYTKQFTDNLPENIDKEFILNFSVIAPPFESPKFDNIEKALKYTNTKFTYNIFDPILNDKIQEEIAIGYMTFFKLDHLAENKLAHRGIGAYTKRTLQPLGGRKNGGGQRSGELETACFIGYDAIENLSEMFTTKSDCIGLKKQYIRDTLEMDNEISEEPNIIPESVYLLDAFLKAIGVEKN